MKIITSICIVFCLVACTTTVPNTNGLGNPAQLNEYQYAANIWYQLGKQFNLPDETPDNPAVRAQIQWYMKNPKYLQDMAEQAKPYIYFIYQQVRLRGLPAELALLPMIESAYNPFAYSSVGAAGLWQMMPGTASGFGLKVDWWYDGRRDIIASTNSALDYLAYLGKFFHGDWLTAIAAYDTGEGTVNAAINHNLKAGQPIDFWHLKLSAETRNYVPKLLALATILKHPDEYRVNLPPVKAAPYLATVDVGSQIDLERAAKMADISLPELSRLNPGFNRWATDPDGPHFILLPVTKVPLFQKQLAAIPKHKRVTWKRYKVHKGDALLTIAKRNKISVEILKNVNRLQGHTIQIGQELLIPESGSKLTKLVIKSEKHYFQTPHKLPDISLTHHVIRKGDTLSAIAKKFDVTPRQIRFWNGLKSNKDLPPGKQLIIWPPKRFHPHHTTVLHYKIRKGDSLISIAKRFHTHTDTLRRLNHIKGNNIRIGHILIVPNITGVSQTHTTTHKHNIKKSHPKMVMTTYKIKAGDSLDSIAKHYHTTAAAIRTMNHIKGNMIHIGKTIKVPATQTHHRTISKVMHHVFRSHQTKTITYHVKKGDTLNKIAKKYHVKASDIKRWNRIENPLLLKLNQTIVIYSNHE